MWSKVEQDLAEILSTRVFHTLDGEEGYRMLFTNAGFKGNLPKDLSQTPASARERLSTAARICAQLIRLDLAALNCVRERRAKAVVIEGPLKLYRLWSERDNNRIRPWWFSSHLLETALAHAEYDRAKSISWLRNRLAISLDFGECNRLAELNLGPASAVPAIEAWGLPMPQYTARALAKDPAIPLSKYYELRQKSFEKEKSQYFLPFIPATRVTDYW